MVDLNVVLGDEEMYYWVAALGLQHYLNDNLNLGLSTPIAT
jgi:hypothetical protein